MNIDSVAAEIMGHEMMRGRLTEAQSGAMHGFIQEVLDKHLNAKVIGYRSGQDRNEDGALSHTYAEMSNGDLLPMCGYGWNRSGGTRLSVFRGPVGTQGDCKICARRVADGLPPIKDGWSHKTRWL